jgi:transposase
LVADGDPTLAELVRELAGLRQEVSKLRAELAARDARIATRDEEIARLTEALASARRGGKRQAAPFSKGAPKRKPKTPGRKKGEDYGPKERRKVPPRIDEVLDAPLPCACPNCGGGIHEVKVEQQYQTEIPKIEPHVTQFDVHVGMCRDCGVRIQGRHPQQTSDALGAAASMLGPRAVGLAAQFHKELGVSFGKITKLFDSVFDIQVSRGGLSQAIYRLAARIDPTFEAMKEALPNKPVISPDETGWRVGGISSWLWVFEAVDLIVYGIMPGRSFEDATEILPANYAGKLARDGWAPYRSFAQAVHQTCLGHLLRRCSELLEVAVAGAARVPRAVQRLLRRALQLRDRRDRGEIKEHGFAVVRGKIVAAMERLLRWKPTNDENRKLLAHLGREHEIGALFAFLAHADLPATNHRAEQAIRPAVVNRKVSGGNRTWNGAFAQERIMSVLFTARRQGLDVLDLFRQALQATEPIVLPLRGLVNAASS